MRITLRIIAVDDEALIVRDVVEYGILENCKCFYFITVGGRKSFLPMESIWYIGPDEDWTDRGEHYKKGEQHE